MQSLHELGRVIDVSGDCLGPHVSMADSKCFHHDLLSSNGDLVSFLDYMDQSFCFLRL